MNDPSWAQISHFVTFLNIQLSLCEKSVFCNPDFVGDVLVGFKTFVVKFMIRMSQVKINKAVCRVQDILTGFEQEAQ